MSEQTDMFPARAGVRLAVFGGRAYREIEVLWDRLDQLHAQRGVAAVLLPGAEPGAARLARRWAEERGLPAIVYHPTGAERALGPDGARAARDERLLRDGRPGLVLALPGGDETGRAVAAATRAGVEVVSLPVNGAVPR